MSERFVQKISITGAVKPSARVLMISLPGGYTKVFRRHDSPEGLAILSHDLILSEDEVRGLLARGFDISPGLSAYGAEAPMVEEVIPEPEVELPDEDEDQDNMEETEL